MSLQLYKEQRIVQSVMGIPSLTHALYIAEGHVVLESVMFPGQHVGVRESGEVKKPNHTGKGKHGQFTPIVKGQQNNHAL